jgi:hypothetical protein
VATATPTSPHQRTSSRQIAAHPAATRRQSPLTLWHLLSFDAPTVAALWTWFIAAANHLRLSLSAILAMGIAVWMLYAADRLLDAQSTQHHDTLEARHLFHQRHRAVFLTGILAASITLAVLLPRLETSSIRLYLILGGLVFGYFILIHATHSALRLPKEIAVGIFFAAATFIPTVARQPHLRPALLAPAAGFATLCSLNCLFIYAWEHTAAYTERAAHATTRLALLHLPLIAIVILTANSALAIADRRAPWPIPCATAIAALLLFLLHLNRHRIPRTTLRAAADLALTTPLLLIPFLR